MGLRASARCGIHRVFLTKNETTDLSPASIIRRSRAAANAATTALGADPSSLRFMAQRIGPGSRRNPRLVPGRGVRGTDGIDDLAKDLV